jgi:predicted nucleic acid-binding Zn ribbon protein
MFESEEQKQRAERIVMLLAKLYVLLELSLDTCSVCHKALRHDDECPISLAWSMLTPEQQHDARAAIRAVALTLGNDESLSDPPLVH